MACLVRVPTEIVKQRMQAGQSSTLYDVVLSTYRGGSGGLHNFYRGYGHTLLREVCGWDGGGGGRRKMKLRDM